MTSASDPWLFLPDASDAADFVFITDRVSGTTRESHIFRDLSRSG